MAYLRFLLSLAVASVAVAACAAPAACAGVSEPAFYTGAVLEMVPARANTVNITVAQATAIMLANVKTIASNAVAAKAQGADILVTPEMSLTGFPYTNHASVRPYLLNLPATVQSQSPQLCGVASNPVLSALGCAAKASGITLVAGLAENVPCSAHANYTCPRASGWQFNTQVVVSHSGALLSVYHKSHLFEGEKQYFDTPPWAPEIRFFDTDFGVRFGQFICFDLFFRTPEVYEARELGIEHFTFSTSWENVALTPLIAAAQLQQAFSREIGVTLLAANYGVSWETSGSGIYVGGTPLNYTFNTGDTHINTLLVAQVPVRATTRRSRNPVLARPPMLSPPAVAGSTGSTPGQRITTFQASPGFSKDMSVVSGDVTCRVSVNVSTAGDNSDTPDTFGVFAWEGVGFSGLLPLRLCAVALCPPGVVPLCSQVDIHTHTEFTHLSIVAEWAAGSTSRASPIYPIAGGADAMLMDTASTLFSWTSSPNTTVAVLELASPAVVSNLVVYQEQQVAAAAV